MKEIVVVVLSFRLKEIARVLVGKFETSNESEPEESLACSFHKRKIEEMKHPLNDKETRKEEAVRGSEESGELEEGGNG